jgi:bifunctional ADP-heptose synthase (sugar kinase/adenylyltransferase)
VLVKGGDWPIEKIIGRDVVEARGGKVVSVGYIEGASTTGIIEKILQKYAKAGS